MGSSRLPRTPRIPQTKTWKLKTLHFSSLKNHNFALFVSLLVLVWVGHSEHKSVKIRRLHIHTFIFIWFIHPKKLIFRWLWKCALCFCWWCVLFIQLLSNCVSHMLRSLKKTCSEDTLYLQHRSILFKQVQCYFIKMQKSLLKCVVFQNLAVAKSPRQPQTTTTTARFLSPPGCQNALGCAVVFLSVVWYFVTISAVVICLPVTFSWF